MSTDLTPYRPPTELAPVGLPRAETNPAAVYLASLARTGRASMESALCAVADILRPGQLDPEDPHRWRFIPWHMLRFEHTQAIRARLMERYSPRSVNRTICAIRGVLKTAWNITVNGQPLINTEDYQRAIQMKRVTVDTAPAGRALEPDEVRKLIAAAISTNKPAGMRDAALIATMYGAGLRRAEAASLDRANYDHATSTFRVRGKRNKVRIAHLVSEWKSHVERWLSMFDPAIDGPMFPRFTPIGLLTDKKLTVSAINLLLTNLQGPAGVTPFTPHDLRRSFGTGLLDAGVDLVTVKDLMGHENIATTAIYDRRGEVAKHKAVEMLAAKQRGPGEPK